MQYTYKHLSTADVSLLRDLNKVFAEAFDDREAYQGTPPSEGYLDRLLSAQHFIALVALDDHTHVVGGLAAYQLDKFEQERSEIYIYDLAVADWHRRRGIARALINMLKDIARERGAYVILVQADPGDDPAIRLYESFGPREDVHQFDIPVD